MSTVRREKNFEFDESDFILLGPGDKIRAFIGHTPDVMSQGDLEVRWHCDHIHPDYTFTEKDKKNLFGGLLESWVTEQDLLWIGFTTNRDLAVVFIDGSCFSVKDPPDDPGDCVALVEAHVLRQRRKVERAHASVASARPAGRTRLSIADDVKTFVWQRDEGRCVQCGSNENLEFDHIIPLTMGGANTARNLQLLCEPCNRAKGGNLV